MEATVLQTVDALRVQLHKWVALATEAEIRQLAAAVEKPEPYHGSHPDVYPKVPASLVKPSDEVLARELKQRRESGKPSVPAEEMYARVLSRFT